jgi:peptide/nickel transport system permease protein
MARYVVGRLIQGLFVVFALLSFVFILVRQAPGDPARNLIGFEATPEQVAEIRAKWGLDQPMIVQYGSFIANAIRGDLGRSFTWHEPAVNVVLHRLPTTLLLAVVAVLIIGLAGITLGALAARFEGKPIDVIIGFVTIAAQSMPDFWVGIMLIYIFAVNLRLFPTSGFTGASSLVLPVTALCVFQVAAIARVARFEFARTLKAPFVLAARARGLHERTILRRHVVRVGGISLLTLLGSRLAGMANGVVVIEIVFGWPGVGSLALRALEDRDYPLLQAFVVVTSMVVIALNLLVDLTYGFLDPRVRLAERQA